MKSYQQKLQKCYSHRGFFNDQLGGFLTTNRGFFNDQLGGFLTTNFTTLPWWLGLFRNL